MSAKLKIIFAGTPDIAEQVLANILAHGFEVGLVLTQPDRHAGRGMKLSSSAVKQLALAAGIEVFQPLSLRNNPAAMEKIAAVGADIMVVVAYGLILPPELLALPRLGCINIHVSLLPRWRGAAPIQRAVLAGDSHSGVSIMQMDKGLDTGALLLVEPIALAKDETSGSLHNKLALLGAQNIIAFLTNPETYPPRQQDSLGVSHAAKITKDEAQINWQEPAELIERKIRGYNPYPGAFTYLGNGLYKIWRAKVIAKSTSDQAAGSIIRTAKDQLWVVCGDGQILALDEIQTAGGKRQPVVQFLLANSGLAEHKFSGEHDE